MNKILEIIKNFRKFVKAGGFIKVTLQNVINTAQHKGKVALITGGTSGFGLAIAKKLVEGGASVVITGRNKDKIDAALKEIKSPNAKGLIWNMTDFNSEHDKFNEAVALFGKLDIAVNNAGIWLATNWDNVTEEEWDNILDINTKGMYFICREEAKYFKQSQNVNKIINITSMEGVLPGFAPYWASKWACNGLTKGLAKELISSNTIVNAIAPGPAKTNLNKNFFIGQDGNSYNSDTRSMTGRVIETDEVASLVSFLASDSANSIIGQIIVIDGGITLR